MATIGADRSLRKRLALGLMLLAPASCVSGNRPAAQPGEAPIPVGRDPEIRIGLVTEGVSAAVGGGTQLSVTLPDGSHLWMIPAGEVWQVTLAGSSFSLASRGWTSAPLQSVTLAPAGPAGLVRVNGRSYRGTVVLLGQESGLTIVNHLGMESYLLGVVSAEMGRRGPTEQAALDAQSVVSRTYALRNLGRWKAKGFDLTASVADQVYSGQTAETPEGRLAVAATRGRVLTYNGAPIEAFFYSTCGGRTADAAEVFRGGGRAYLRSVPDQSETGSVYCSISPRYRWREEWSGDALRSTLQRNLPSLGGIRAEDVRQVSDVRVARRSASGRVDQLAIGLGGPEVRVDGPSIRQVMRASTGEALRSTAFSVVATGGGQRVTHLTIDGMGSGHGVGFCQWGAVGRARAGQGYEQILAAYFPGTRLERRY
ncbi:MAG: SpoIID/LytB domain-containing protein [Gemmatimonadales bacterium]